jgi:hypothetical protein
MFKTMAGARSFVTGIAKKNENSRWKRKKHLFVTNRENQPT